MSVVSGSSPCPVAAMAGALFGAAGSAQAATVTVGSPLTAQFEPTTCLVKSELHGADGDAAGERRCRELASRRRCRSLANRPRRLRSPIQAASPLAPRGRRSCTRRREPAPRQPRRGPRHRNVPDRSCRSKPVRPLESISKPSAHIGFADDNGGGLVHLDPRHFRRALAPFPKKIVDGEIGFNADIQLRPTVTGSQPLHRGPSRAEPRSRSSAPTSPRSAPSPSAPRRRRASRSLRSPDHRRCAAASAPDRRRRQRHHRRRLRYEDDPLQTHRLCRPQAEGKEEEGRPQEAEEGRMQARQGQGRSVRGLENHKAEPQGGKKLAPGTKG